MTRSKRRSGAIPRSAVAGASRAAATPAGEEWFQTLAESTATCIFVYDEARFLYGNPAALELTGYDHDTLCSLGPAEILHPDDREPGLARLRARLDGDRPSARQEFRIVTGRGDGRWVLFDGVVVDFQGRTAVLASASDITDRKEVELALQASQERLELAQRAGRSLVWEWDVETDSMQFSTFAMELFGAGELQVPRSGDELMAFIPAEDQEVIHDALRAALRGEAPYVLEHRIELPSGGVRWLAVRGQVLADPEGGRVRILGVSSDITEHKLAEEALEAERERAQVTLASIGDGVIRTDTEGRVDYLNPVAEDLTGYTLREAVGRPLGEIYRVIEESGREPRANPVDLCLTQERVVVLPGHSLLVSRDGSEAAIRDSAAPIQDPQGRVRGAVLVVQDITQLRGLEREMTFLARHDPLTGLINRREMEGLLETALETAHRGGRQHALCYLDLDEFKLVNDTSGHVAGDELLRQLSGLLASQVRDTDTLARLGGDEFAILLRDCAPVDALDVAHKLGATVRQFRFTWEGRMFNVGVSIGVVPIVEDSGSLTRVLAAADAACYVAKEQGRNRVHLYEPDDEALARRQGEMQWVQRIHQALEEDRLRLFWQPIYRLGPEGPSPSAPLAELLVRMLDDEGEPLPTANFVAAAERYHLIGRLDRWVVRRALRGLAADPSTVIYTVNLSGHSLGDGSFLHFVHERLESTGADPRRLCFEITETATITNLSGARRFISALRRRGCRFVLDDFGTGLSSFSYLKSLPVDFLKIDGEFVRHMMDDKVQRALVESIDQIGHLLGLSTIAESVEDQATLEALGEMGVDFAQGFHLGYPEPWEWGG